MALCGMGSATAMAQQPAGAPAPASAPTLAPAPDAAAAASSSKPAKATPQSEAGEPRADTSGALNAGHAAENPVTAAPAPSAAPATPAASAPDHKATASRASGDRTAPGSGQKPGSTKVDRLDLGTATVTGDREQPKVMYIVPWKKSDIGDLAGKPMNSLVDEILAPVDRDVFKREVVYYHAVQADTSQNGAPPKPAQQGEK
jgi:hypothetical protein